MVAMSGVLISGIAGGTRLQCPIVRQGPTGDHQSLGGPSPLALDLRLHPPGDHLHLHRVFLAVSYG